MTAERLRLACGRASRRRAGPAPDTLASAEAVAAGAVAAGAPCAQAETPAATPAATASAAIEATSLLIMPFGRRRTRIGCSSGKRGRLASGYS